MAKSPDYISLSLSEDTLKVAHVKSSGGSLDVLSVEVADVKETPEDQLPKIIQAAIKKMGAKSAEYVCVVPPSMTTTKNIEIPSINPEEIKSIVSLQAGRHTPLSREEIQIGFVNLGVYKSNYSKVLLVIANRTILKNQLSIFEKAGVKVKRVLFAPEGISRLYSNALNLKGDTAPTGIIDIGSQTTDFVILFRGMPIASRNIPIGKAHLSGEDASVQEKLIKELGNTIESYQSEDIEQVPGKYFLSSDDDQTKALQSALAEKLEWNVEISSYVDLIKASQGTLSSLAADASFLDVIAPVSIAEEAQVNLIPEEIQLQESVKDQGKEIFTAATLSIVILIIVALSIILKLFFSNSYLTKLKNDYQSKRSEVAALDLINNKTNIIQSYLGSRMNSLDVINELYKNVPNEIYLTSVFMDEEGNVNIQGISEIASLVFNLGSSLKESDVFKSVEIKSTTAKKDRGKDVSAFEISLRLQSSSGDDSEEKTAEE